MLLKQAEGFTHYRHWDFANTPPDQYPLLLNYPYYLLYSSQVVKQADLVFAMYVCGDCFSSDQRARDVDYYEAITVRDSSLSASIQAIMAAEVGHTELAYDYLSETAFIDLHDLAFNTRDGVHLAALAGSWLVAVACFGGIRDHGDTLHFAPRLPARLTRLSKAPVQPVRSTATCWMRVIGTTVRVTLNTPASRSSCSGRSSQW